MTTNPITGTERLATITDGWVELPGIRAGVSRFHHRWLRDNCPEQRHPQLLHRRDELLSRRDVLRRRLG